jgi:hypothetical protein
MEISALRIPNGPATSNLKSHTELIPEPAGRMASSSSKTLNSYCALTVFRLVTTERRKDTQPPGMTRSQMMEARSLIMLMSQRGMATSTSLRSLIPIKSCPGAVPRGSYPRSASGSTRMENFKRVSITTSSSFAR